MREMETPEQLMEQAAAEVDRSLLRWALEMSPLERLRACTRAARALARLSRVASQDR